MVEAIKLMRCMWTSSPASFERTYYHVNQAFCEPHPGPVPFIMIAEHADWWNTVMRPVPVLSRKLEVLREHCNEIGQDFATIRKSLTRTLFSRVHPSRSGAACTSQT